MKRQFWLKPFLRRHQRLWKSAVAALIVLGIVLAAWRITRPEAPPAAPGQYGVFIARPQTVSNADALHSAAARFVSGVLRDSAAWPRTVVQTTDRRVAHESAEELRQRAERLNASAMAGLELRGKSAFIILYLRLPTQAEGVERPDLDRLRPSLVYPERIEIPSWDPGFYPARRDTSFDPGGSWFQTAGLIHAHILLASGYGAAVPPMLNLQYGKVEEDYAMEQANFAAGTLSLASAIAANAGSAALEQAVACLSAAHDSFETRDEVEWAAKAGVNLASALLARNRVEGGVAVDLAAAGDLLESLRGAIEQSPDADVRDVAQYLRAQIALALLPQGGPGRSIEALVGSLRALQADWTREESPYAWAAVEMLTARALSHSSDRGATEDAIDAAGRALAVWTRDPYPGEWASAQSLLGSLYARRATGTRNENARFAMEHYENALEFWREDMHSPQWMRDTVALATVRLRVPSDKPGENVRQAIAELEAALEVADREASPREWARIHNTLGVAWHQLAPTPERAQRSLEHFRAALEVRTIEAYPLEAARTLANMGNVYRTWPAQDNERRRYLNLALTAYDGAISALQIQNDPSLATGIARQRRMVEEELARP